MIIFQKNILVYKENTRTIIKLEKKKIIESKRVWERGWTSAEERRRRRRGPENQRTRGLHRGIKIGPGLGRGHG